MTHGISTNQSVLSEVYAADKMSPPKISPSAINSIIRKATIRRVSVSVSHSTRLRSHRRIVE